MNGSKRRSSTLLTAMATHINLVLFKSPVLPTRINSSALFEMFVLKKVFSKSSASLEVQ